MRIVPVVGVLVGLSFLAACRDSSNAKPDAGTQPGPDSGSSIRVQDVQSPAMVVGTAIELRGVIVTAIDRYGSNVTDRNLWVQDPAGGPNSGVHVFRPPASVASLVVGDIVDITGAEKDEFTLNGDTTGNGLTEVVAPRGGMMTVTKVGSGAPPAPVVVDALAIGRKSLEATRDTDWEQWEGVLITVNNVTAFGAPACILSQGNCNDPTRTNLFITGTARLESNLAAFPTPELKFGDCLASVTGVLDYAFDYVVFPRSTADVVTGGTGCAPREGVAACADDMDNDGNGFKDCSDLGCQSGPGAWIGTSCMPTDATCGCSANLLAGMSANKINTGTRGAALLHDVFVTAIGLRGFWVADALQAVGNGGVFVFTSSAPDPAITIGAKLETVQGFVSTFGSKAEKLIQVGTPTASAPTTGGDPLPITIATAAQLADLVNGRSFMGSLVSLGNVKVTAVDATTKRVTLKDNNNVTIIMDDGAFPDYPGATIDVGTCYSTLTGVMDLLSEDQIRTINPRKLEDVAVGIGCN